MRNIIVLCIHLIIFIILSGLFYSLTPLSFNSAYIAYILIIVLISTISYSLRAKPKELKQNYFTISLIFLISFSIVHFQIYLDYSLSIISDLSLSYYLDYNIVPKAITLAALALVSYQIGGILSTFKPIKKNIIKTFHQPQYSLLFLKISTIIFFALFVYVTPVEFFKGNANELFNSGGVGYLQYKVNHFFQLFLWSYIIANILNISNSQTDLSFLKYLTTFGLPILSIVVIYLVLNTLAGDRGPIINIAILILVGYIVTQNKKFSLKEMLIVIVIGGSFLQFASFLRETDGNLSIIDRIESALSLKEDITSRPQSASISPITRELAGSVRAYHTVVMDQETNDIIYGASNLGYFVEIVPGLGPLLQSVLPINLFSSASYITEIMGADHGMGTTILADIYLNYGSVGVILVFAFFGYLFSRLDIQAYSNFRNTSLFIKVLFFLYISYALYLGRSTFAIVLSDVVLVYFLIKISTRRHSKIKKISVN